MTMINKYIRTLEITKDINNKSYYMTMLTTRIPQDTFQFTVVSRLGDRFDSLATKYYKDATKWWIIAKANNMVNGSIFIEPGKKIIIPSAGL